MTATRTGNPLIAELREMRETTERFRRRCEELSDARTPGEPSFTSLTLNYLYAGQDLDALLPREEAING